MENGKTSVQHKPVRIVGLFNDQETTEKAIALLRSMDYHPESIMLVLSEEKYQSLSGTRKAQKAAATQVETDAQGGPDPVEDPEVKSTKAAEGLAIGATAGAALGSVALLGASLILPGSGIVFLGPLAAALTGAGAGATVGGLFGSLIGSGHPEDVVEEYKTGIGQGKYVVGIEPRTPDEASRIEEQWKKLGGKVRVSG